MKSTAKKVLWLDGYYYYHCRPDDNDNCDEHQDVDLTIHAPTDSPPYGEMDTPEQVQEAQDKLVQDMREELAHLHCFEASMPLCVDRAVETEARRQLELSGVEGYEDMDISIVLAAHAEDVEGDDDDSEEEHESGDSQYEDDGSVVHEMAYHFLVKAMSQYAEVREVYVLVTEATTALDVQRNYDSIEVDASINYTCLSEAKKLVGADYWSDNAAPADDEVYNKIIHHIADEGEALRWDMLQCEELGGYIEDADGKVVTYEWNDGRTLAGMTSYSYYRCKIARNW